MKKFKLMQIVPEMNSGGVEQGTLDVANFLGKNHYNNVIVSNGGKMLTYLDKKRVSHYKLPVHSKNFFTKPILAKKINKIITQENINILHVRSRAPAWLLPFIKKTNLNTISTFHNIYGHENYFKKIYNSQLSKVDIIVAISKYVKNEIIKIYKINPNKIKIINRGIDFNFFNNKINDELNFGNFINKKNIDPNKKIILFPGRLTKWKGQIEFLKIIEYFKDEPIKFYFVGDDKNLSYYNRLSSQINYKKLNNSCQILGHLNKEELKIMYQCSDIIISAPIKPEGFGRTISESLAMKKIILAYNFGGAKDQLEDLSNLYKVKPFDFNELKEKINIVLNLNKNDILTMVDKARINAEKKFSNNIMLSSYKNLYEEIID